ncbi:Rab21c [Monocercomonoides exilis]|uniref:Rab21c n=1 Tax=Monocercomonoides exilis TaxID=2049356 RepID=UPI003559BB23|nr:Rab21c [Monocercomonoides exilis]|eukprot:MONOS_4656.1-p1 / transcript=MONOS_4656.1 / gene=MONOS_4656 / organism=Monocercomonoides_exilis_PA203 / gene_product=Rab21c / transcript_product=Rab21c / location=Mono_scaffold00126:43646-44639(-) / protein_length=196 / sequence_SO=supercontig / SO=protein_coding / is_pseudo=false
MSYKVVFLGEGRVGKTSLIYRFTKNIFNEKQPQTVGANSFLHKIKLCGSVSTLDIWDTAGQERHVALGPIYYRDAQGAILVYDICDIDSFIKVKKWVRELHEMVGKSIVIVICGNKIDRERERVVDLGEAEAYAASVGATHFTTSAKSGRNVQEVFATLTREMRIRSSPMSHKSGEEQGLRVGDRKVEEDSSCSC